MKNKFVVLVALVLSLALMAGCANGIDALELRSVLLEQATVESMTMDATVDVEITLDEGLIDPEDPEATSLLDLVNNTELSLHAQIDNPGTQMPQMALEYQVDMSGVALSGQVYSDGEELLYSIPGESQYYSINLGEMVDMNEELDFDAMLEDSKELNLAIKALFEDFQDEFELYLGNIDNVGVTVIDTENGNTPVKNYQITVTNEDAQDFLETFLTGIATEPGYRDFVVEFYELMEPQAEMNELTIEDVLLGYDEAVAELNEDVTMIPMLIDGLFEVVELGENGVVVTYLVDYAKQVRGIDMVYDIVIKTEAGNAYVTFTFESRYNNINSTIVEIPEIPADQITVVDDLVGDLVGDYVVEPYPVVEPGDPGAMGGTRLELTVDSSVVMVDGYESELRTAPVIKNGSTMVPVRFIGESLGATVEWIAATRTVIYSDGSNTIELQIDNPIAIVNGQSVELNSAPIIHNGSTMVPVRFVSNRLGARVDWNSETRGILIVKSAYAYR